MNRLAPYYDPETTTRTQQTQAAYLQRGQMLWRQALKAWRKEYPQAQDLPALELAQMQCGRRFGLAPRTWRVYKAGLLAWIEQHYPEGPDRQQALALVAAARSGVCTPEAPRTSALRVKHITQEDLDLVRASLKARGGPAWAFTADWLYLGAEYGLRPAEWRKANLLVLESEQAWEQGAPALFDLAHRASLHGDKRAPEMLEEVRKLLASDMQGPVRMYLQVENCKSTNGRSHGTHRHLDITERLQDAQECSLLARFILAQRALEDEAYRLRYGKARRHLRETGQRILAQRAFLTEARRKLRALGWLRPKEEDRPWNEEAESAAFRAWLKEQTRKGFRHSVLPYGWRNEALLAVYDRYMGEGGPSENFPWIGGLRFAPLRKGQPEGNPYVRLRDSAWGDLSILNVTLYTGRHRFSSTVKNLLDEREVAALMGHGVDDTAGKHYARKDTRSGFGKGRVRPVQAEISRVKRSLSGPALMPAKRQQWKAMNEASGKAGRKAAPALRPQGAERSLRP